MIKRLAVAVFLLASAGISFAQAVGGNGVPGANTGSSPFQSLTTTGTSGPATLNSGVLNIPQYTGGNQTVTTITPSATPAITAANGLQTITLSANATPTISGIAAGQRITFQVCQPASGGPYTWTWPAAIHGGMTIGTTASTCSQQSFDSFSGTTLVPESTGALNVAP